MSKMDLIPHLLQIKNLNLSRKEKNLMEVKLLPLIYAELAKFFFDQYKNYLELISINYKEQIMHYKNVVQDVINDILSTGEYTLNGLATYACTSEDVLLDILIGVNNNPTLELSSNLFALHASVRCDLYNEILEKIILQYLRQQKDKKE